MLKSSETTLNERLTQLITEKNLSVRAFALAIGLSQNTVDNYFKGRTPGFEFIEAILTTYGDINPDWLILGKGSMYRGKPNGKLEEIETNVAWLKENFFFMQQQIDTLRFSVEKAVQSPQKKKGKGA